MNRDEILQFVNRDWSALDISKERFWHGAKARRSASEVLTLADRLRRHVARINPGWPSLEDRLHDIAVHQRVSEALRAVVLRPR